MHRIFNIAIFLSFFVCYIDWGHDGATFIGGLEFFMLSNIAEAIHSTIMALLLLATVSGQVILLFAAIKPTGGKDLTISGITLLGVVVALVAVIGVATGNIKTLLSVVPFLGVSIMYAFRLRKEADKNNEGQ